MRLVADAFPDFFLRGPETDDQRVNLERVEIFQIGGQATAGGNHGFVSRSQFSHHLPFQGAESRLTFPRKNVGDCPPGAGLDEIVRVEKIKMQMLGDHAANGGLARAHEADERENDELAVVVHGDGLAENRGGRTPKWWCSKLVGKARCAVPVTERSVRRRKRMQ